MCSQHACSYMMTVYEQVLDATSRAVGALTVGDPFDPATVVGPVVNKVAYDRILEAISDVGNSGVRTVVGGHRVAESEFGADIGDDYFIEPTVLADVDPNSEVAQKEVFGPVLSVTRFSSEAEAIELDNATPYGLGTFVQTRDVSRAHRIASMLESGSVAVNGNSGLPPGAPFGGYKLSGFGREGGREGLQEFLRTKNVHITLI